MTEKIGGPWLLIDDIRDLNTEAIARTSQIGMKLLQIGDWRCVCFDHDLGDLSEMNGYQLMCAAVEKGLLPGRVQLVTSNPVGRKNMANLLEKEGYVSKDGINFFKELGL
jgi:hypothetical protein